jgi:dihydroorotate dehydrogenase (fumarate)
MDLQTNYLGLELKNPIIPGASPLSQDIANIKKMEDMGAAAVVLYSLFEEQIEHEELELNHFTSVTQETHAEALTYFPYNIPFKTGPEEYLEHIRKAKDAVEIPVIASLNGKSIGGWTDYAKKIESAGADALELNIYQLATDLNISSAEIEKNYVNILKQVKSVVNIPVAVKLPLSSVR